MPSPDPSLVHSLPRPFDAVMLDVGDGHWIYVERIGRPDGVPALFLHGGPGSGAQHSHRSVFDVERFHALLFDQRGAGRSHPYLSTEANTTAHLIADVERIRQYFGIEKWYIVGGSWGSTLALAYAQSYPYRVAGMVLRAVFLGTPDEVRWAFVDGPRRFRPELYAALLDRLPSGERADPLGAFLKRLTNPDPDIHRPAAKLWNAYERTLSELNPAHGNFPEPFSDDDPMPPTPIMEAHYICNNFFLTPGTLLKDVDKLGTVPCVIIQGRYDLLCPPGAAYELSRHWPACRIEFVETAGHAMTDPGVAAAMRRALLQLADDWVPKMRLPKS